MKIYLFPKRGREMQPEEFEPLVEELQREYPDLTSEHVWYETRALQLSPWEVLTIYIAYKAGDAVIDATVGKLVEAIIEKGKRWVQRHRDANDSHHRPFALTVRDGEGKLLAAIDIDPDGVAKDARQQRPPKEMPPIDLLPEDIQ